MHVIESLGIGGAEQALTVLLPALQCLGHDTVVAVRGGSLELAGELEAAGVQVIQLPARHKWNLIGAARDISRVATQYRIDILHAHLFFPSQSTALVKLLRLHSAATVVTFHNLAYAKGVNKGGLRLRVKRMLASLLYPGGFDLKLAVSDAVATHYRRTLGLRSIEVVYNPVDVDAIDCLLLGKHPAVENSLHIVTPGRLVHEKGQSDLLEALALLRDRGVEFTATFVGDGPMRDELEYKTRRNGLGSLVTFSGFLQHRKLLEVVAAADIVVIPSRFEGFGMAAIEAMALSRPLVVTAAGGLVEIVEHEHSGIVVPVGKPQELAAALHALAASPAMRETFGSAGRARVERQFSLPSIARKLQALYQEVLGLNQAKTDVNADVR
jgi:glycosyltransferase involved in cell wall biosynthesis